MKPSRELIGFSHELADAAGAVILEYWRCCPSIEDKTDSTRAEATSPVTAADRGAEEAMRALISDRYPSHGILGEEFGAKEGDDYTWVLDPIDGTKSFMTGKPLFGTLIALCYRGEPILGVIDQCVLKERWVGTQDGTFFNGVPCQAQGRELSEAFAYATTPHMFVGDEIPKFAALQTAVKRMLYGCDCYAYALLASGHVHIVCEADLQPYDYMALIPVLQGAGAVITDWEGHPLTFDSQGQVLAAASLPLHREALALLRRPPPFTAWPLLAAFFLGFLAARALK